SKRKLSRNPRCQPPEAFAMTECPERLLQLVGAFGEMGPAIIVDGHDQSVREDMRGLDGVIGVHGQIKLTPGLCSSCKQQHEARVEAPLDFSNAIEPYGVASNIDGPECIRARRQHETGYVARERLDTGWAVPCRRRRDQERFAIGTGQLTALPWLQSFGIST